MFGYRNIWYNPRSKKVHLWTWNENGERVERQETFNPYLYIESNSKSDGISIFDTPLRKITFPSQFERRKYVNECGVHRLFFNLKVEQQYLLEKYLGLNETAEFSSQPLRVYFLDIEVYSPNEFPEATAAQHPINLLTVYDSLTKTYHTFGTKPYTAKDASVIYHYSSSEAELLQDFLNYWTNEYPDVVSGWNSEFFDIPYIINRITNVLGADYANKLSPVNSLYFKEDIKQQYGKTHGKWVIHGLSCVDYMEAYTSFSRSEQESYSLDYISKVELGEGKVKITATNLAKLSLSDWSNFVDYNIQDVRLLTMLEEKLRFLKIMRMIAYKGFTGVEATLGKVMVVTGAIAAQALQHNKMIATFEHDDMGKYAGGFVKEIEPCLTEGVITFDANSLYPNTLITLNLSPETKVGKIVSIIDDKVEIRLVNAKSHVLTKENFAKFVEAEKLAVSKAKVLYSQKVKGIIPEYIDSLYAERVKVKGEMDVLMRSQAHCKKDSEKYKENEVNIAKMDMMQYTLKILLNSIYGVFANRHSAFYDIDHASSITLTGQATIKQASLILDEYAKTKYGVDHSITHYNDTDSCHVSIKSILDKLGKELLNKNNELSTDTYRIANDLSVHLNTAIIDWAKNSLNSTDARFFFKREAICAAGIYQSKKHYILHIKDKGEDKPLPCDKIKYVGVEVATSKISDSIKKLIKKVVETLLYTKNREKTLEAYRSAYEQFKKMQPEEIAFRSSINKYEFYDEKSDGFATGKGTPCHVKAALYYNKLLKLFGVENNYDQIQSGNKIKWVYCLPTNKYSINNIAFLEKLPTEFKDIQPDYDKMFEKIASPAIERLFECAKWRFVDIRNEFSCDLLDLFKI